MTAEIAIMNKEAVALATDSAVTINGKKIYNSANKLFALSKHAPVGIMIYGNAAFMGVPIETIVKVFRKKLGITTYDKLEDYSDKFINFLNKEVNDLGTEEQEKYLKQVIGGLFQDIKTAMITSSEEEIKNYGKISQEKAMEILQMHIDRFIEDFNKKEHLKCYSKDFLTKLNKSIEDFFEEQKTLIFQNISLTPSNVSRLKEVVKLFVLRDVFATWHTGIVIAGFGENEIFPAVVSFNVEGIICEELKFKKIEINSVGFTNNATIIPFAQSEMVGTFIEGVDPNYRGFKRNYLQNIFDKYPDMIIDNLKELKNITEVDKDKIKKGLKSISQSIYIDYIEKMNKFTRENYIDPILAIVGVLPKDELTAMAESLVNLTSFKRKISMDQETVGGPIDVAVISKGDGFIWIKRKHYFKAELNPNFFNNSFNGGGIKYEKKGK